MYLYLSTKHAEPRKSLHVTELFQYFTSDLFVLFDEKRSNKQDELQTFIYKTENTKIFKFYFFLENILQKQTEHFCRWVGGATAIALDCFLA